VCEYRNVDAECQRRLTGGPSTSQAILYDHSVGSDAVWKAEPANCALQHIQHTKHTSCVPLLSPAQVNVRDQHTNTRGGSHHTPPRRLVYKSVQTHYNRSLPHCRSLYMQKYFVNVTILRCDYSIICFRIDKCRVLRRLIRVNCAVGHRSASKLFT
jgi:hypothetical protein